MWPSSALNILSALNIVFILVTNVKTVATYDSSTKYLEVSKVEPFLCCCHVDIHLHCRFEDSSCLILELHTTFTFWLAELSIQFIMNNEDRNSWIISFPSDSVETTLKVQKIP